MKSWHFSDETRPPQQFDRYRKKQQFDHNVVLARRELHRHVGKGKIQGIVKGKSTCPTASSDICRAKTRQWQTKRVGSRSVVVLPLRQHLRLQVPLSDEVDVCLTLISKVSTNAFVKVSHCCKRRIVIRTPLEVRSSPYCSRNPWRLHLGSCRSLRV